MEPYWTNGIATLFQTDARSIPMPDKSAHCVCTSPPYFGLRVYRSDSDAMIGLEPTVQGWLDSMLAVMDEVKRVLRDDGTLWCNLGDSYGGGSGGSNTNSAKQKSNAGTAIEPWHGNNPGQLLMIPARFAIAMQEPRYQGCIKSEIDRAWLAAMMDGEGTISIRQFKGGRGQDGYIPFIQVGNTNTELLEECRRMTGYGKVYLKGEVGVDARGIKRRVPMYGWRLDANKAIDVIQEIYPRLIAKRKQAILAYSLALSNRNGRVLRGNKVLPQEEQAKRALLKEYINMLNQHQDVDIPSWCCEPPGFEYTPGWILRSDVIWHKKSCMPESLAGTRWERCRVKVGSKVGAGKQNTHPGSFESETNGGIDIATWADCPGCPKCADTDGLVLRNGSWRCTSSHEHIFQFVKSMGYYSDGEAVKTAASAPRPPAQSNQYTANSHHRNGIDSTTFGLVPESGNANRRNVWNDISPEPYGGEHYATFPSDLPRICIQASTSEAGVCAECGNQWARVVETSAEYQALADGNKGWSNADGTNTARMKKSHPSQLPEKNKTLSWRPTCQCQAAKVPATVLDCFAGTFTTGLAAMRLGRRSYGTDLSADYLQQAVKRLSGQNMPMEF